MRLTVLGCAGSFPGPEAACSAYLLEAEGFRLLIDFGSGSLSALQRYSDMNAVDAIVLTHLHCDHMLDACTYIVVGGCEPARPPPPVPFSAPLGAAERISAAYSGDNEVIDDVYTFYGLQPGTFPIGPFTVTVDRVNHPIETYGVRVEQAGKIFAYSSDTAPCEALLRLAAGADLFLCEASYLDGADNPPGLHLTGGEAGEAATKADVSRLLLTHLVPAWVSEASIVDAATAAYAGPVEVVRPGARYDL
jgi:ribonuclease BN (tRNA processing enzyme)